MQAAAIAANCDKSFCPSVPMRPSSTVVPAAPWRSAVHQLYVPADAGFMMTASMPPSPSHSISARAVHRAISSGTIAKRG